MSGVASVRAAGSCEAFLLVDTTNGKTCVHYIAKAKSSSFRTSSWSITKQLLHSSCKHEHIAKHGTLSEGQLKYSVAARAVSTCKHHGLVRVQALALPAACVSWHFLANKCRHGHRLCIQTLFCSTLAVTAGAVCACKHHGLVGVQALGLPATCASWHFLTNKCRHGHRLCIQTLLCGTVVVAAGAVCACKHHGLVRVQALGLPATCASWHFLTNKCRHGHRLCIQSLLCGTLVVAAGAVCACKHHGLVGVQALGLPATCASWHFLTNKCCHGHRLCIQTLLCGTLVVAAGAVCACKHHGLVRVQALGLPATCISWHFLTNKCRHGHRLCIQTLLCGTLVVAAGAVCACKHHGLVRVQALGLPATCISWHFLTNQCRHGHRLCIQPLLCGTLVVAAGAVCACKHHGLVRVQALGLPATRSNCALCCAFPQSLCLNVRVGCCQNSSKGTLTKKVRKMIKFGFCEESKLQHLSKRPEIGAKTWRF